MNAQGRSFITGNGEWSYLASAKSRYLEVSERLRALSHLLDSFASVNQSKIDTFGSFGIWFGRGTTLHVIQRTKNKREQKKKNACVVCRAENILINLSQRLEIRFIQFICSDPCLK